MQEIPQFLDEKLQSQYGEELTKQMDIQSKDMQL